MQCSYEGAPAGVGAKYAWTGNEQVSEGRMTIEKSEPGLVRINRISSVAWRGSKPQPKWPRRHAAPARRCSGSQNASMGPRGAPNTLSALAF